MALMLRTFTYLSLLAAPALAAAETRIAGIAVPDSCTLAGQSLVLNGAAVRSRLFVDVYVGALYLPALSREARTIVEMPGPKSMHMHVLYGKIPAEKIARAWHDGFRANLSEAAFTALEARLKRFNRLFPALHRGDSVRMDYVPGQGTRLSVNESLLGRIDGEDFFTALLEVWIGARPADEELKQGLLAAP